MPEIGKAYVQIVPTAKGISSGIEGVLDEPAAKAGSSAGKKMGGAMMKAAGAGIAAAAAGVISLAKEAISGYADYEQLVGGVETLFKGSADVVQSYAADAYRTAGLSANEYMETVTSFSASLLQSLGGDTAEAARISDMAITDMADNANKMGSDMSAIQSAYQGFAKQNYTMLDNLKLGYGGTKTEMERLLADAEKFSGVEYDIDNLNDVYEAIHVIQSEMGITGTTAKEAASTISGSTLAMKSAWKNLVVGIADENADFDSLVSGFTDSVGTVAENLLPRISVALQGIGSLITGLAPVIAEAIPILVTEVLPTLLESAATLLMTVVNSLIENLPMLFDVALQLILTLADGIIENLPTLIPALVDVILTIVEKLTEPDMLMKLIDASIQLMIALAEGLIKAIPRVVAALPQIIANIVKGLLGATTQVFQVGGEILQSLGRGLLSGIVQIGQWTSQIVGRIKDGLFGAVTGAWNWGKDLIGNFVGGIKEKWNNLKNTVSNVAGSIRNFLGFSEPKEGPLSNFHTFAPDMMALFAKGIKDNEHLVTDQIGRSFSFENEIVANGFDYAAGGWNMGGLTVNVYGAEGQSAQDIADAVMERIQAAVDRREAVFA